jgi:HK97 family phage prohead protease
VSIAPDRRRAIEKAVRLLNARELDLYLEQVQVYRQLVAANAHRGVPLPTRPLARTLAFAPPEVEEPPLAASSTQPALVVRTFAADLTPGSGRTLDALIVPYGKPTRVADAPENGGTGEFYVESWRRGAFAEQTRDRKQAAAVYLNFEHARGIQGIVGRGLELRDTPAGLEGTFRLLNHSDADKALELVKEGTLNGISLEARVRRSERRPDGSVERVKARLDAAALCRRPAYAGAQVLALRVVDETPHG